MAIDLRKPVTRRVSVPGHGYMNVTLTADGISFRAYKARTTLVLPYGPAIVRAAFLHADANGKTRKRRTRRGVSLRKGR